MPVTSPRSGSPQSGVYAPTIWGDIREWCRKIAEACEAALEGKVRSVGTVTLTADAATTTITDRRIGVESFVQLMPLTENAGGELGVYVSSQTDGSLILAHATDSRTDRTFRYVVLG